MATSNVHLYALPASHPCEAVVAALKLKSLPYERTDLLPLSQLMLGPLLYGGTTVPGLRVDGERIAGSRAIMRRLDALIPEPPLLPPPGDPSYARVLELERWGDDVLQGVPRRLLWAAFVRRPRTMESYAGDAKMPLPVERLRIVMPLTARLGAIRNSAGEDNVRADLAALPEQLARIDGWIEEELLGGERPNAADLQIGSSIHLLMSVADVRPVIEHRRAASLARYFSPLAGEVPAGVLPAEWTAPAIA